jgi:uncharacterized protein
MAVCQDPTGAFVSFIQQKARQAADAPPYWQVYLVVDDIDAAIEKTKSDGGRVLFGPQEIPVGKIAVVFDPQGANVSLIETNYPQPR